MPKHPSGTPCRTVHRSGSQALPSLYRATPPVTSEHFPGLLGSQANPSVFVTSCVRFQLRPLPSTGITRLLRYYGPPRHPMRPGLSLTSFRLIQLRSPRGLPVLRLVPVCIHAIANTPAGLVRPIRSCSLPSGGLPSFLGGSAPASPVSGPARRSLTLRPACSPGRLRDPLHQRLQRLRCLHRCSDCYRAERSSSRVGLAPTVDQRPSRRTLALRLSALGGVSAYNNVVFAGDQYLTNGFRSGFTSTGMFSFGKSGVTFTLNDTAAVSTGVWNWFGITYLSGSASLYRNGALAATVSGTYIVGTTNMGLDAGTGGVDFY